MRILIIGSGGREHALAWKLRQSPLVDEIHITPGNGGTVLEGKNVAINDGDIAALVEYARKESIDLVVPGPELPLTLGIVDACVEAGIRCFGPSAYAAQLEGSKVFSKEVMRESGVPTAEFRVFTSLADADAYVEQHGLPIVIKADGLAAGKGVVVARTKEEAYEALDAMMRRKVFGASGERVLVEDVVYGEEISFLCLCDGETVIPLPSAQDHKAVFDNDDGPNTGGMGAYSPAPLLPDSDAGRMADLVIQPVLRTLKNRGHPFCGVLYAGIMMTDQGPIVLEYNVRFGDPECQPLFMRLQGDLAAALLACVEGRLGRVTLAYSPESALCVVMSAKGYPGPYEKGMRIQDIDVAEELVPGKVMVFHAGTKKEGNAIVSSGGRVLGVTALGGTLAEAQHLAYRAVHAIRMDGCHYRKDIGAKALRKHAW